MIYFRVYFLHKTRSASFTNFTLFFLLNTSLNKCKQMFENTLIFYLKKKFMISKTLSSLCLKSPDPHIGSKTGSYNVAEYKKVNIFLVLKKKKFV